MGRIAAGIAVALAPRVAKAAATYTPVTLFSSGEAGGFYDPSDLSTVWQDSAGTTPGVVNQPVGRLSDKSGNSNHLLQATTAAKPVLRQSGSLYYLEFDGVDDILNVVFGAAVPVTYEHVHALRMVTWGGSYIGGGNGFVSILIADGVSPQLTYNSGIFDNAIRNGGLAVGADGVIFLQSKSDAPSGTIAINRTTTTTGATGTTSAGGITVGNNHAASGPAAMRYYGGLIRGGVMAGAQRTAAENFFAAKAGVTLP